MKLKNLLQRKVYILFFISLLTSFATNAQTWDSPVPVGSSLTNNGQYYVYSVGAKAFLVRNGDWGTQASVAATGALITAVQNGSDWVLQFEGSTRTLFRSAADANGWVYTDNSTNNTWNIQVTDATSNIYSIQCPSSYAAYNATQFLGTSSTAYSSAVGSIYDVRYNRTASDHTKWLFVAAADVAKYNAKVALDSYMSIAKNVGSSVDLTPYISAYNTGTTADITTAVTDLKAALTVTDKTSSITNPTFASTPTTGWTVANYSWSDGVLEFYRRNGNTLTQTITGLQAGVYMVKYQGFQRPYATASADRVLYNNGQDMRPGKVSVVAGGVTTSKPLPSLFSETTCPSGVTVDGFKFPGSKADAKAAFDLGLYDNEIGAVTVDATGSLTITTTVYYRAGNFGEWNVVDNFRLYYYGALTVPMISSSKASLTFNGDDAALSDSLTVTGANLSGSISITAPAGITVNPTTLASDASNAKVYVTYDGTTAVSGNITFASGSATTNVAVTGSANTGCFTPLFPSGNLVTNPLCTNIATYRNWGSTAIITGANAYCGSSVQTTGDCGGSIDYALTGKLLPNTTYRLKAMMYTNSNGATISLVGCGIDGSSADKLYDVNTGSTWQAVDFTFTTGTLGAAQNFYLNSCGTYGGVAKTATDIRLDNFEIYKIPAIYVAEASVPAMTAPVEGTDSKTIKVKGNGLTEGVSLALSGTDASLFSVSAASLPLVDTTDSVATTVVTINYAPTAVGSHTATLTLSSAGAADKVFELSGTATAVVTGIGELSSKLAVYESNKTLVVKGANSYEVFGVDGQRIAPKSVNGVNTPLVLKPGVYVVKTDKGVRKVIVK